MKCNFAESGNLPGTGAEIGGVLGHCPLQGDDFKDYLHDSDNHPVFLTRIYVQRVRGAQRYLRTKPLSLRFKKDSKVIGVVWFGINETLRNMQGTQSANNKRIPNNFHDESESQLSDTAYDNIRNTNSPEDYLNTWLRSWSSKYSVGNIQFYKSQPCIRAENTVTVTNVAIGAIGLPFANGGENEDSGVFQSVNGGTFKLGGLYLVGNAIWNGDSDVDYRGYDEFDFQGFAQALLSVSRDYKDAPLRFAFGGQTKINAGSNAYNWNLPCNNIHLLTNSHNYMDVNDCATINGSFGTGNQNRVAMDHGPGFRAVFGQYTKSRMRLTSQEHWHNGFNSGDVAARRQGIAGFFGLIKRKVSASDYTIQHTLTVRAGGAAQRTSQTDNTTNTGEERMGAGSQIFYDRDYVLFQRNGRAKPEVPALNFIENEKDTEVYESIYKSGSTSDVVGYVHPTDFVAIGMPITSADDTCNVKCFVSAPRIDFKSGISANQRAYI